MTGASTSSSYIEFSDVNRQMTWQLQVLSKFLYISWSLGRSLVSHTFLGWREDAIVDVALAFIRTEVSFWSFQVAVCLCHRCSHSELTCSGVVLDTKVLVSRRLGDKKYSLGLGLGLGLGLDKKVLIIFKTFMGWLIVGTKNNNLDVRVKNQALSCCI